MANPMLSHFLNIIQGAWTVDSNYAFRARPAATVKAGIGALVSGRACHLALEGSDLVFKTGVDNDGVAFFYQPISSAHLQDTVGDTASDPDAYVGFSTEGGVGVAVSATSGYELLSTEYVAGAYPPNTPLTADKDDADDAVGGVLAAGLHYVNPICGIVSQGIVPSGLGGSRVGLAFHAVVLPKLKKAAITAINAE